MEEQLQNIQFPANGRRRATIICCFKMSLSRSIAIFRLEYRGEKSGYKSHSANSLSLCHRMHVRSVANLHLLHTSFVNLQTWRQKCGHTETKADSSPGNIDYKH
jgi:hypothetical protein